jgi:hypothetical protein
LNGFVCAVPVSDSIEPEGLEGSWKTLELLSVLYGCKEEIEVHATRLAEETGACLRDVSSLTHF